MFYQKILQKKALFTIVAFESLFCCVSFEMGPQIATLRKSLVTAITFERFFICVNSQMYFQISLKREVLFTIFTFERFCVFLGNQTGFFGFNHFYRFSIFNQLIMVEESWRLCLKNSCVRYLFNTNHATSYI